MKGGDGGYGQKILYIAMEFSKGILTNKIKTAINFLINLGGIKHLMTLFPFLLSFYSVLSCLYVLDFSSYFLYLLCGDIAFSILTENL